MAYLLNNLTVIDNSRNLANINSFDSTITSIWDVVTVTGTGKTLVNREHCTVTSAGQTFLLPSSPSAGWEVAILVGDFANTIISGNGQNIMGLNEPITLDVKYAFLNFIYTGNPTQGWRIY